MVGNFGEVVNFNRLFLNQFIGKVETPYHDNGLILTPIISP
jgi:hypothetical protein